MGIMGFGAAIGVHSVIGYTDFVHLAPTRTGTYWCDLILVMTFAWNGLLLGFVSLYLVQGVVRDRRPFVADGGGGDLGIPRN